MTMNSIRKRLDRLWRLQESLAHQRIVGRRDYQTFVSLACYDSERRLRSVVLEDGICLDGEEASHAMRDLADPRHTRVVGGIDLDVVLGEKAGPGL
jgi:hypothetical protein